MTTHVRGDAASHRVSWANRFMLWLLGSRWHRLGGRVVGLRYTARTGATVALPVEAARAGDRVVVMAGHAAGKRWWRHFRTAAPVEVLGDGAWLAGTAMVVTGPDSDAAHAYRGAFPRVQLPPDATFVVVTLDGQPAASTPQPGEPLRGRPLMRAWFWTVTGAEFIGFAVPAGIGALTASARPLIMVPALLAAGLVEGSMLGWGQARVLGRALPGLPRRRWVLATAVAAAFAYAVALVPSSVGESLGLWPIPLIIGLAAVLGVALLGSIGFAQWLTLRHFVAGAARWIATTALAWLVGLGVFMGFATPLWQPGQPLALTIAIGVVGGLLMAATTSAITGLALRHLLNRSAS